VALSRGPATPAVMFFSSFFGRSGIGEYARLAPGFSGARAVSAVPEPGFAQGEPLPATLDALVTVQAEIIRRSAGDRPFVLAGHSSGGMVAHAVAARLASTGLTPAGLVLIDTYTPGRDTLSGGRLPALVDGMLENSRVDDGGDEAWLTAMLHYSSFDWAGLEKTGIPTLHLRAAEHLGDPADGTRGTWALSTSMTEAQVPGGHFTMLTEHAATTAQAVSQWLDGR
jgi:mycoketide-CoA synthase